MRHREEKDKCEKKNIRKAFKEIVQHYCCYYWFGLILGPFQYLTQKKKKKNHLQKNQLPNCWEFRGVI